MPDKNHTLTPEELRQLADESGGLPPSSVPTPSAPPSGQRLVDAAQVYALHEEVQGLRGDVQKLYRELPNKIQWGIFVAMLAVLIIASITGCLGWSLFIEVKPR